MATKPDWTTLVGKFFHTIGEDGYIEKQGQVIERLTDAEEPIYVVRFFEWFTGSTGFGNYVVPFQMMANFMWYATDEDLRDSYEHSGRRRPIRSENGPVVNLTEVELAD